MIKKFSMCVKREIKKNKKNFKFEIRQSKGRGALFLVDVKTI